MALPAILLKAKGVIEKAKMAKDVVDTAKNAKNHLKSAHSTYDEMESGSKVGCFVVACSAVLGFLVIIVMVLVVLPLNFLNIFGATSSNPAYANESAGTLSNWDELYFLQTDAQWNNERYGYSTIGFAGCGLCSITHSIDLLEGETWTPVDIRNQIEDFYPNTGSYYTSGGSIVSALIEFAVQKYGYTKTQTNNIEEAAELMKNGGAVMILSSGGGSAVFKYANRDGKYAANHVIMAYKFDGEFFWVKDSGSGGNQVKYTKSELAKINHIGFYILSK